jgi:hypothetical protein
VSCEVLSCEIWSICETVVQSRELLNNFWKFIDRPSPLNPLQASYFTKVNEQFLEKKTDEVCFIIPFLNTKTNNGSDDTIHTVNPQCCPKVAAAHRDFGHYGFAFENYFNGKKRTWLWHCRGISNTS